MSVLKKNIYFNLLGHGSALLLGFISFKYIYTCLGEDALGIIYFSIMLSTLITSSIDMGFSKTIVRELAVHLKFDKKYVIQLTRLFSLYYCLIFGIVLVLFVVFLRNIVNSWIVLTTIDVELAYHVLFIIGSTSLLAIPKSLLTNICIGMQRMDINNSVDILISIFLQSGLIILLKSKLDVITVAYWIGLINVLKIVIYLFFVVRLLSFKSLVPKFSKKIMIRIRRFTTRVILISLVLVIQKQLDKVIISKLLPIGVLGIYSFVFNSLEKTSLVTGAVSQAVFPFFSAKVNIEDRDEICKSFFIFQDFLVFGTVPIFTFAFIFSKPIFSYLLGSEKAVYLQFPVFSLCIGFYLSAVLRLSRTYLFAVNKPGVVLKADIKALFLVVPSTIILVYRWGINGAALSWIVFYLILIVLILPILYRDEFGLKSFVWLNSLFFTSIFVCVTYLPFWYMVDQYYSQNILLLILAYVVATLCYGTLSLNFSGAQLQSKVLSYIPKAHYLIFSNSKGLHLTKSNKA